MVGTQLEYANILSHVGKDRLFLTHVDKDLLSRLPARIAPGSGIISTEKAVLQLEGVDVTRVILLDPAATQELKPEDGDHFDYLLFGGILVRFEMPG